MELAAGGQPTRETATGERVLARAKSILLASHDTPGGRAAAAAAMDLAGKGGMIHHLIVVPDFWKGMLGDDWLNNIAVHRRFGRYVENQLEREIAAFGAEIEAEAGRHGISYSCTARLGKPAECIAEFFAGGRHDLVVVGSPRPKGVPGYRSRLAFETLVKRLTVPLMVVPHPGR